MSQKENREPQIIGHGMTNCRREMFTEKKNGEKNLGDVKMCVSVKITDAHTEFLFRI